MNDEFSGRGVRRDRTRAAGLRQVAILKSGAPPGHPPAKDSPHYFAKRHALDCGQAACTLCGNPRHNPRVKGKAKLTVQELRSDEAVRFFLLRPVFDPA